MRNTTWSVAWRRQVLSLVAGAVLVTGANAQSVAQSKAKEYEVKAAILIKLLNYVRWPAQQTKSKQFVIGIVGANPFGKVFDSINNKILKGTKKTLVVRHLLKPTKTSLRACHVVFVSDGAQAQFAGIVKALGVSPVLIVANDNRKRRKGVMISLVRTKKGIRWRVDDPAAKRCGIQMSSMFRRLSIKKAGG